MLNRISPNRTVFQFAKSIKSTNLKSQPQSAHSKHLSKMRSEHVRFPSSNDIGLYARIAHEAYILDPLLTGMGHQMNKTLDFLSQISLQIPLDSHQIDEVFALVQCLVAASENSIPDNLLSLSNAERPFYGFKAIVLAKQESQDIVSASLQALGATVSKNPAEDSPVYDCPQHIVINLDTYLGPSDLQPSNLLMIWRSALQNEGILFCLAQTDLFGNSTSLQTGFIENQLKILYFYNRPNNETFVVARPLKESDLRQSSPLRSMASPNGSGGDGTRSRNRTLARV